MKTTYQICQICGKHPRIGYNRPKSLHRTTRLIKPNLQKFNGLLICNNCRRTLKAKRLKLSQAA